MSGPKELQEFPRMHGDVMNWLKWSILEQDLEALEVSQEELLVVADVLVGNDPLVCELNCGTQVHEIVE